MSSINANAATLSNKIFGQDRILTSVSVANTGCIVHSKMLIYEIANLEVAALIYDYYIISLG